MTLTTAKILTPLALLAGAVPALAQTVTEPDLSPKAISADGGTIIGSDSNGPVVWSHATGSIDVGTVDGAHFVNGVSADGARVVSRIYAPGTTDQLAGYWDASTGNWTSIGGTPIPGGCGNESSEAHDVSDDGTVIVGRVWDGCFQRPFKWTTSTIMTPFAHAPNTDSEANAVSGDGLIAGGWEGGTGFGVHRACLWKADGTQHFIAVSPSNPNGDGEVQDISGDGTFVVGSGPEPWLWSEAGGLTEIGLLPGMWAGFDEGIATGVTDNGKIVVGHMGSPAGTPFTGFIWTADNGLEKLEDWLLARGIVLPGHIRYVRGISADGRAIVGSYDGAFGPFGTPVQECFLIEYPPATVDLGGGSVGAFGTPVLSASGNFTPGSSNNLHLENAGPGALTVLMLSLQDTPVPFLAGTLHTLPIELSQGVITGGTGEWDLALSWPQGITSAVEVYFQSAVFDTTVFGWLTLSNGLQINTL